MKGYQPAAGSECSAWTTDEVWNPVMQEILGQEQVTLLAVATSDPFNDDIETGNMTACRCTHRVEYTGIITGGEVTGGMGVNGTTPCKQLESSCFKLQEFF